MVAATNGADLAFKVGAVVAFAGGLMVAAIRFKGAPGRSQIAQSAHDAVPAAGSVGETLSDPGDEVLPVGAQI